MPAEPASQCSCFFRPIWPSAVAAAPQPVLRTRPASSELSTAFQRRCGDEQSSGEEIRWIGLELVDDSAEGVCGVTREMEVVGSL